ncbi:alpha/beta fold hydrolase [Stappia sp. GBMRC 2046]|uniref:Alpha/beta fold hydrolase n=1 Tax=Stappia sediminis TaxID=2692190 RepID=A0A7X3LYA8_9HYPH|nr:alpha/beta hydrolase [Stappia sediminis]MXN67414.1 alpha/beta fold hydrolase [Stappia sediminis]
MLMLAACGGRPGPGSLAIATTNAPGASEHLLLVATTREKDERPGTYFNGERSQQLNYAEAVVSVPPTHQSGQIEWPAQAPGDPAKDMVLKSASYLDGEEAFRRVLNAELAKREPQAREVVLFIHGYNTRFPEALFRFAQFYHDSSTDRVPVLFTWASRGELSDYVYDTNSATAARDGLERTIRDILASGAKRVHIMAHSMGNWVLMETIRQIKISGKPVPQEKIGLIVLAAPDLDIDVFKSQLKRVGRPERPFIILLSKDDRALKASSIIAGGKERVGRYEDEEELAELGAIIIDLTKLEGQDAANHAKFAQVAAIAPQMRDALVTTGFDRRSEDLSTQANGLGRGIGEIVGTTAGIAITLPVTILTAPVKVLSGSQ